MNADAEISLRPIILAGGLGTRLRPRTYLLPKPLLPIAGRPILWYAINSLFSFYLKPIITLDYKGELIRAYFESENVEFVDLPNCTMAEAVLRISELYNSSFFLGLSSDVIIPPSAIQRIIATFNSNGRKDTVLFTRLDSVGHKKWNFLIEDNYLSDIKINKIKTNFERVLLIFRNDSLKRVRELLGTSVEEKNLPSILNGYQCGWNLLFKALLHLKIPIYAEITDIPVCNINVPADFNNAKNFIEKIYA